MKREHHRWFSPSLGRDMDLLVIGHAGARVLVFPTSNGKYYEWADRKMPEVVGESIEKGWLQWYCVDSVDSESWYADWAHPAGRAYRHTQYDGYLYNEVLPLSERINSNPFLMTVGASFGAYHAMNFGLKHADKVNRILALSGLYDIRRFTGGYSDSNVYFNNPLQFIPNEHDDYRLSQLRRQDIIIATGQDDTLTPSSRAMSAALWDKGIGNALRIWDGWSHDWPYWERMLSLYVSGHD
jgi:esterase/lipase superfamily enzyme